MADAPLLVRGRVLDIHGHPVAGATLWWASAPAALPDIAMLSGADGGFVLSVPVTGRYVLAGRSDAHGTAEASVDVTSAGADVALRLTT